MQRSTERYHHGASMSLGRRTAWMLLCASTVVTLQACALVELSGKMTRTTGEVLTDYSKEKDSGFLGRLAGFGGRVNTAVGTTVEGIGKKGKDGGESPGFIDANKAVLTAAINAAPEPGSASKKEAGAPAALATQNTLPRFGTADSQSMSIAEMQTRLTHLGYQTGAADGTMGKRSIEALRRFQKERGLAITGRLDSTTADQLRIEKKGDS